MPPTDVQLITDAKQDTAAFEAVYRKYAPKVFNYFWYRVGHNKEVAEDLMQETFVRAFQALPKYVVKNGSYLTYLLTIAHNLLVNYYRTKQPVPLEEAEKIPVEITDRVEHTLATEQLWQAIQDLPDSEKDAIYLMYREDKPVKDMAQIMGKSENAVKLLLSRARKRLRQHPKLTELVYLTDISTPYTKPRFLKVPA